MKNIKLKVTIEEVKSIAFLAKLTLTPDEIKKYQKQLTKIFDYIEQIGAMETKGVEKTTHPLGNKNVFREDKVDFSRLLTQKEILSNALLKQNTLFKVKAIFE